MSVICITVEAGEEEMTFTFLTPFHSKKFLERVRTADAVITQHCEYATVTADEAMEIVYAALRGEDS